MAKRIILRVILVGAAAVTLSITFVSARAEESTPQAVYTPAQAAAGRAAYESTCTNCHTSTLIPPAGAKYMGQTIPPLAGPEFMSRWGGRTTRDLSSRIKTAISGFPPKGSGETTNLDITAYVLEVNGGRAGTRDLTADTAVTVSAAAHR